MTNKIWIVFPWFIWFYLNSSNTIRLLICFIMGHAMMRQHIWNNVSNISVIQVDAATYLVVPLHYITLHYITLHYITLHYITLHYITLHYITLHYITLHYITLHYITLHYITLHYITLHYITLHYITLHYITLHYITLHYITLHYITLHYITLWCNYITSSRPPNDLRLSNIFRFFVL